jgi:hypothetical protein
VAEVPSNVTVLHRTAALSSSCLIARISEICFGVDESYLVDLKEPKILIKKPKKANRFLLTGTSRKCY